MLRSQGHEVFVPHEADIADGASYDALIASDGVTHDNATGGTWGDCLARDVKIIADGGIEGIVVLPGWAKSRGARLEVFVGLLCKLPIYWYHGGESSTVQALPEHMRDLVVLDLLLDRTVAYEVTAEWTSVYTREGR